MRSFALAIAALLLLTSCTDEPEPIEPTASPSAKPSATAPSMPKEAKADNPSGAATFVGYWVSTFNYAAQTGDVEKMLEHAQRCKPCRGYAEDFRGLAPSDRAEGPVWKLSNVSVSPNRNPIEVAADVEITDEEEPAELVFVLNKKAPFELVDIYKSRS